LKHKALPDVLFPGALLKVIGLHVFVPFPRRVVAEISATSPVCDGERN
jgi:hypothetical protein